MDDLKQLREYAETQSEEAFSGIVSRHVNLVYSSALRQTGRADLAQDVTQVVFLVLARKAGRIPPGTLLSGWLFRATRFAASKALRQETRRAQREIEAMATLQEDSADERQWEQISPMLDEAMLALGERDRNAVLLRFFEQKSFRDISEKLGGNEESARKRVLRAVEKLRHFFARRRVVLTGAVLASLLSGKSVAAAPAGCAAAVASGALQGAAVAGPLTALANETLQWLAWTKLKAASACGAALAFAVASGTLLLQESGAAPRSALPAAAPAEEVIVVEQFEPFHWGQVESTDYRRYIANLQNIGCPWETICDIIVAEVNALYARRTDSLHAEQRKRKPYWFTPSMENKANMERQNQITEAGKEKMALLRELLGSATATAIEDTMGMGAYWKDMMNFLPEDKRSEVSKIHVAFSDKAQQISEKAGGFMDEEILAEMQKVYAQRREALAKLLGPAEMLEFDLRFSQTSDHLRLNTPGYQPTEEEFRTVFAAWHELDEKYGPYGGAIDPEDRQARRERDALKKELEAQIKQQMEPDRYRLYARSQDSVFNGAQMFAGQHDWPEDMPEKIYDLKEHASEQAGAIRADSTLSAEAKKLALQRVQSETREQLREMIPHKAADYLQWSQGWLKQLSTLPKQ